jgi:hypothetical protein
VSFDLSFFLFFVLDAVKLCNCVVKNFFLVYM